MYILPQFWDNSHFRDVSLKSLGLVIQLNHSNTVCDNPIPAHKDMLVIHVNGIHAVSFQYCGCNRSLPYHHQLLRRRLYPSSQITVRTCATFDILRQLHLFALTTKSNTYNFYRALEKLTVHNGVTLPKSRYKALMRVVIQWRHLKLLKRGGRGNEPTGVIGTAQGVLAIMCPSCPRPGINLPSGWDKVAPALRYSSCLIFPLNSVLTGFTQVSLRAHPLHGREFSPEEPVGVQLLAGSRFGDRSSIHDTSSSVREVCFEPCF